METKYTTVSTLMMLEFNAQETICLQLEIIRMFLQTLQVHVYRMMCKCNDYKLSYR